MIARVLRCDRRLDPGWIDVAGVRLDVDEHRPRPEQHDHLSSRDEGERRRDDLIARFHVERHQRDEQRLGAGSDGDAVLRAGVRGELRLELGDFRAEDVLPVVEHLLDAGVDRFAQRAVLGLEVDEVQGQSSCGMRPWISSPIPVDWRRRASLARGLAAQGFDLPPQRLVFRHPLPEKAHGHAPLLLHAARRQVVHVGALVLVVGEVARLDEAPVRSARSGSSLPCRG